MYSLVAAGVLHTGCSARAAHRRGIYSTVYTLRLIRKLLGFGPRPVSVEKLKPGQFLSVEAIDPRTLSPAERKRYKR